MIFLLCRLDVKPVPLSQDGNSSRDSSQDKISQHSTSLHRNTLATDESMNIITRGRGNVVKRTTDVNRELEYPQPGDAARNTFSDGSSITKRVMEYSSLKQETKNSSSDDRSITNRNIEYPPPRQGTRNTCISKSSMLLHAIDREMEYTPPETTASISSSDGRSITNRNVEYHPVGQETRNISNDKRSMVSSTLHHSTEREMKHPSLGEPVRYTSSSRNSSMLHHSNVVDQRYTARDCLAHTVHQSQSVCIT
jgi:hypothetical protein